MTQHYQREKDLQEANTRLELVLEGTQLGMWDWNPQTNEVVFNERWATMLGYSFGEISNSLEEWSSRVHPDDVQQCFRDIELHIQGITGFYENVHRMKHKDGSWHYILDRGKVVERDAEGKAIRFTGTHTDITREKLAELRAIEANKVKTMFLANMSHEIRTPLNGIVGVLDLLSSTRLNDEQKELLSLGTESCTTLSVILNDVLDLSKIDAGKMHIDMTSFNFHRLFDSIASIHSNLAKSKGLDFVADYDESIPEWLVSDRHRIRQILSNLCSNALKFTHKGHIRFGVKLLDRLTDESGSSFVSVQFDIEDSGVGITSDKLDLIFHDFTQSDNSISRRYGGTGLGLSICRKLSALLDGEILVSSKENQGSTFSLKMMLRVGSEEAELSNVLSRDSYRNLKVLVAEDNRINQIMISKILKQFDIVPDIVPNGKEAVHAVLQKQYDIILMDVHMPVMTGIEAAQRISESCVPRSPFVVACTADVIDKSKESFSKYGFHDLVSKPFDSKDIAACLSRFEHHAQRPKRSRASL
jgi:PAS domain S-box-containing protein